MARRATPAQDLAMAEQLLNKAGILAKAVAEPEIEELIVAALKLIENARESL